MGSPLVAVDPAREVLLGTVRSILIGIAPCPAPEKAFLEDLEAAGYIVIRGDASQAQFERMCAEALERRS